MSKISSGVGKAIHSSDQGVEGDFRRRFNQWAQKREEVLSGYAFLLPSAIVLVVFVIFPVVYSFYLSLHNWNYLEQARPFIGLQNYQDILTSPDFWRVLRNTVYYTVGSIPLIIIVALSLALLLNRKIRGLSFYRTAYFAPVVTSTIVLAQIWYWIYDPRFGLLNSILDVLGLPLQRWILDPNLAMPSIIVMNVWHTVGYVMIIYLAALQGVPEEYHEAAKVDGAGRWQDFRHITWPLLAPTTFFVLIMLFIGSFQVFGQIYVLTWQTPMLSRTESLMIYLYKYAFVFFEMGYASAIAYLLFLIIFIVTLVQFRFRDKFEY